MVIIWRDCGRDKTAFFVVKLAIWLMLFALGLPGVEGVPGGGVCTGPKLRLNASISSKLTVPSPSASMEAMKDHKASPCSRPICSEVRGSPLGSGYTFMMNLT